MTSKRAIYIISYNRVDNLKTLKMLRDGRCTFDMYIVVSKDDPSLNEYRDTFKDMLIEFDREEESKTTDSGFNQINWHSPIYARNFCLKHARDNAIDSVVLLDDDLETVNLRYEEGGKLKGRKAKDLNNVLAALCEFVEQSQIGGTGAIPATNYIGGLKSKIAKEGFNTSHVSFFVINMNQIHFDFNSYFGEDVLFGYKAGLNGKPFIIPYQISVNKQNDGTGDGGMQEAYSKNNEWKNAFTLFMNHPSVSKMYLTNDGRWRCKLNKIQLCPKILSEEWKR